MTRELNVALVLVNVLKSARLKGTSEVAMNKPEPLFGEALF